MNKNQISVTVKSQSGGTWPEAVFNVHQKIRHLLNEALRKFHMDSRPQLAYEVLLVRDGGQRSLPLDESLADAGVRNEDILMVRTIGHTTDG